VHAIGPAGAPGRRGLDPGAASAAPWPLELLAPRREGVPPVPFRQFVLKIRGRCNLACDYCYLYTFDDQGWRDRPARMSAAVVARTAERIAEHAATHRLDRVELVLHGGEPLMGGARQAVATVAEVRRRLPGHCALRPVVQTNGVQLSEPVLEDLAGAGIRVGVSLDGGSALFNRHRVDHAGRPSWDRVRRAVELLRGFPGTYAGILATIDPTQDPVPVYESLAALDPPALDLLLPHGNWTTPPPGLRPARFGEPQDTPYADWLCAVFDHWWSSGGGRVRVRLFEEVLALLMRQPGTSETLGVSPVALAVVETDGSIEQVDALKSAYPGASATGLDVRRHSFDDALEHPGFRARQLGADALSGTCRRCPVGAVCGGGQYPHRYRAAEGFRNPSVYCADLTGLIRHVHRSLRHATGGPAR
jgi:uncharacterized protein